MSGPAYRVLRIVLRVFSLLAAIGGLFMILADKPLVVRVFLRPPEGEVSTLLLSLLKEMGGVTLMAESAPVACRTQSGAQRRHRGRADCGAMHSLRDTASLAMGDRHSEYLSGVSLVGTIRRAARNSSFALLAEAAGDALGTCRKFLKIAEQGTGEVTWSSLNTVALRLDPNRGNGENPVPSSPCPRIRA